MQDRYVGDVGDFGKYGLLRSLCRGDKHGPAVRLGVLWYRFDGDESTAANDGRHIDYLCAPSRHERFLRQCDPDLFEKMLYLVKSDRSIAAVEANHVLPADTVFFSDGLNFKETPKGERDWKRHRWFNAGLRRIKEAEVVFFDPDNGLEVPSRSSTSLVGPKYVYYDDLQSCWERGQSLVVYHHVGRTYRGRKADAGEQIRSRCQELREKLSGAEPMVLRYRRRSPRVYFVISRPEHAGRLKSRIDGFLDSPWCEGSPPHFERVHY